MARAVRAVLRALYTAVPFKQPLFSVVRRFYRPAERLQPHLWFRGVFEVDAGNGARLRLHNDHGLEIENSIFWTGLDGEWESVSLSIWMQLCRRARVVIDVGANTGIYSLLAKAVNPAARVYAIEPIERIYNRLVANSELNGFDIACLPIALTSYDGEGVMYDLPYDHVYAVMLNKNLHVSPSVERKVPVLRGDTLIRERNLDGVDLIKIDVESHEPEVLEGFRECLERMRPTLLVEVWNDDIGSRVQQLLDGKGYLYYSLDEKSPPKLQTRIVSPGAGYFNYLICTPEVAAGLDLPQARS